MRTGALATLKGWYWIGSSLGRMFVRLFRVA